jgi:hypothetical protein
MPKINVQTTRTIELPDTAFEVNGIWFVPRDEDSSKKYAKVAKIVDAVRQSRDDENTPIPVEFKEIADAAGERYPQDVQAAMQALEVLGRVEAFKAINPESGAPKASVYYRWIDDTPTPDETNEDESMGDESRAPGEDDVLAPSGDEA